MMLRLRDNMAGRKKEAANQKIGADFTVNTVLFLLCLAFLSACQVKSFIPGNDFVNLYVDLKLVSVQFAGQTEQAETARRVLLSQYKISPSQYEKLYQTLLKHPDAWDGFYARVLERLERLKKQSMNEGLEKPEL